MSVQPVPHFQTLYLQNTGYGVRLQPVAPSIGEFGRLHFNRSDLAELADKEKKRIRQMAFGLVKRSELPVSVAGKAAATTPKITVVGNGRIVVNGFVNKAWAGVTRVVVLHDPDSGKVALIGLKADEKCNIKGFDEKEAFIPTVGKPNAEGKGGGDYSLGASGFLKTAKYDYTGAGNQTFDAVAQEISKMGAFVFVLPKETPKPRPVTPRKKKEAPATVAITVAASEILKSAPVEDDEALILE